MMAPLLALLTMDLDLVYSHTRYFSTPVLLAELIVILLALQRHPQGTSLFSELGLSSRLLGGLWLAAILVSMAGAEWSPHRAQLHTAITLLHAYFALAVWSTLKANDRLRHDCLLATAIGVGVFSVIAYCFSLWNMDKTDFPWARFGVGVTNVRHLGYISLTLTGISAGLWMTARRGRAELLPATLFFVGAFLLMWSGGRGAFVALLIQLGFLLIIAPTERRIRLGVCFAAALVIATVLAGIYVPGSSFGPSNIFLRIDPVATSSERYLSGRGEVWRQTVALIPQQLWFGYGEAQFRWLVPAANGHYNHPHNLALQLMMQWGVVGTFLFAAIMVRLGWKTLPLFKAPTALTYPCLAVMTGLLAVSMVDGPFFYPLPTVLFLLALATLIAETDKAATFRK